MNGLNSRFHTAEVRVEESEDQAGKKLAGVSQSDKDRNRKARISERRKVYKVDLESQRKEQRP